MHLPLTLAKYIGIVFISLCLFIETTLALEADRDQPIDLEANSAVIDDNAGIHIYTGQVVVTQGTLEIKADNVKIHLDTSNEAEEFFATGIASKQAYMKQANDSDGSIMETWADNIYFNVTKDRVTLTGNARLIQKGNQFNGDVIEYSTANEKIIAKSDPDTDQRVKMTIIPDK